MLAKIVPKGKNEIKLPEDSKQTIVWDEKLSEFKAVPPFRLFLGLRFLLHERFRESFLIYDAKILLKYLFNQTVCNSLEVRSLVSRSEFVN